MILSDNDRNGGIGTKSHMKPGSVAIRKKRLWDADECSLLSIEQMRLLKDTGHD